MKTYFIPGPKIAGSHMYWRVEEVFVRITSVRHDDTLLAIPPMGFNEFQATHFTQFFTISRRDKG